MQDEDIPGLAMSRSFGDLIAAQCGVICEPDIKILDIQCEDKFIVIASDGVWEFLNNRDVMLQIVPYYIRKSA
ncbi:protein phosphatase 2c, putative, partial [Ichthyophthirius multifiliis]